MEHRARVGVECPRCHSREFMEIHLDRPLEDYPLVGEIRAQLEAWVASRCPEHLAPFLRLTKN